MSLQRSHLPPLYAHHLSRKNVAPVKCLERQNEMENNRYYGEREGATSFCLGHPPHPLQYGEMICHICGTLGSGSMVGIYQVQRLLGSGRSGQAYLAEHQSSKQPAVIKLFLPESSSPQLWEAARREVRVVTALHHSSILPVFSCATWFADYQSGNIKPVKELQSSPQGQRAYLLTLCQYIPNTVQDFIAHYKKRDAQKALYEQDITLPHLIMHLVQQMGSALHTAHLRGIAHGAIVPGNILLTNQNWLWVADFGLARLHAPADPYLAPELYTASSHSIQTGDARYYWKAANALSDQYSFGIICQQLFAQLLNQSEYDYLSPVLQRAMQQRPEMRYSNVELFVQDLMMLTKSNATLPVSKGSSTTHAGGQKIESNKHATPGRAASTPAAALASNYRSSGFAPMTPAMPGPQMTPAIPLTPLTPGAPLHMDDWERRGDKLFTTRDYEGALQAYHRAIEVNSEKPAIWLALGDTYFAIERYKEALMAYEQAMYLDPNDPQAWSNRGTALDALGRRQEAADCYERAEQLQVS